MKSIAARCGVRVEAGGESLISSAGGSMLLQTAAVSGLAAGLSRGLAPWRQPRSMHDPGKTVLDLAVAIALGGDCLADVAVVRAQPQLFGAVASDPTISRLIETLAADPMAAIARIREARAAARDRVWGHRRPFGEDDGAVVIDVDATLVGSHSEKEGATPNFKRGFGFHPLLAFIDHGAGGTGEPLAAMLRPGKATANDAADQIALLDGALAQLPAQLRSQVLVRGDTGSGVHGFVWHVHNLGLEYSVGIYARQPVLDALAVLPKQAWRAALDADGFPREGAQVAELTRWLPTTFTGWPARHAHHRPRERPHPGAQLRITDHEGRRITILATNTRGARLAELELRHRRRARAEDRIRGLKDTGMTNLPLQAFAKNQIWLELVQLAAELLTWTQLLAWHDQPARTCLRRGLVIAQDSGNRMNETGLAAVSCRLEAKYGDPLVAFEYFTVAIGNYHDSGNTTAMRTPLAVLAALFTRLGRHQSAATVAGFAFNPATATWVPEMTTAIANLRNLLGDDTYNALAHKGATMTTAALAAYAYDEIDQARAERNAVSK